MKKLLILVPFIIIGYFAYIHITMTKEVVDTARYGTVKNIALNYIDQVEKQVAITKLSDEDPKVIIAENGTIDVPVKLSDGSKLSLPNGDHEKVFGGKISITENGLITSACLTIKMNDINYKAEYDGKSMTQDNITANAKC